MTEEKLQVTSEDLVSQITLLSKETEVSETSSIIVSANAALVVMFLYRAVAVIIFPILIFYLKALDMEVEKAGPMLSSTPIFCFIFSIPLSYLLDWNFKVAFLGTLILPGFSQLLLIYAGSQRNYWLMLGARAFFGTGIPRVAVSRYMYTFIPSEKFGLYSFMILACVSLGACLAPLIDTVIFYVIPNDQISYNPLEINKYSCCLLSGSALCFISALIIAIFFTNVKIEEKEEAAIEDTDEIDYTLLVLFLGLLVLFETNLEVFAILLPFYNLKLVKNPLQDKTVNVFSLLANLLVFSSIFIFKKYLDGIKKSNLLIFFSALSLTLNQAMTSLSKDREWLFIAGFSLQLVLVYSVLSIILIRFGERNFSINNEKE